MEGMNEPEAIKSKPYLLEAEPLRGRGGFRGRGRGGGRGLIPRGAPRGMMRGRGGPFRGRGGLSERGGIERGGFRGGFRGSSSFGERGGFRGSSFRGGRGESRGGFRGRGGGFERGRGGFERGGRGGGFERGRGRGGFERGRGGGYAPRSSYEDGRVAAYTARMRVSGGPYRREYDGGMKRGLIREPRGGGGYPPIKRLRVEEYPVEDPGLDYSDYALGYTRREYEDELISSYNPSSSYGSHYDSRPSYYVPKRGAY